MTGGTRVRVSTADVTSLPELPNGHDHGGDGYDWMDLASHQTGGAWRPIASWGADGWDLGDWPYVVVMYCRLRRPGDDGMTWGLAVYVEGDLDVRAFTDREEWLRAVDDTAHFYWRLSEDAPDGFPLIGPARAEHCGPMRREEPLRPVEVSQEDLRWPTSTQGVCCEGCGRLVDSGDEPGWLQDEEAGRTFDSAAGPIPVCSRACTARLSSAKEGVSVADRS